MEVWTLMFNDEMGCSYVISVSSSREKAIKAMNKYNKNFKENGSLEEEDKGQYGVSYRGNLGRYDINCYVIDDMIED